MRLKTQEVRESGLSGPVTCQNSDCDAADSGSSITGSLNNRVRILAEIIGIIDLSTILFVGHGRANRARALLIRGMNWDRSMDRRRFMLATGAMLLAPSQNLLADHHVISATPLIVESDLWPSAGRYTRVEDFYVRNHFQVPDTAATSLLTIEGEVDKPGPFTLDNFQAIRVQELGAVLECAGQPVSPRSLVSDGVWQGRPLGDILSLAGPKAAGTYLHLFGQDGFSRSVPFERAMNEGYLVSGLNGRPLARNHGAPWRALFPGSYGMDSVKWLKKIVVADAPLRATDNTYLKITTQSSGDVKVEPLPKIQVKSVITAPGDGAVLQRGKVEMKGLAWSGSSKISQVDVSADEGASWRAATLDSAESNYDWAMWQVALLLVQPGAVNLTARAKDAAGNTQPASRDARRVDLYAYNVCHRIRCVVV
jgi:DMSO/TMAO reductase YedYZ molybdopterin-dependent catalytic subunit